ncbi:LolA family protein [Christiangramia antarctica]|uniref:Outer membrane lipoprotein carrier protein LolA n=2 Tax=Christiangramia TaxID=292691 RepID=A0ABW5X2R9_9FLAO
MTPSEKDAFQHKVLEKAGKLESLSADFAQNRSMEMMDGEAESKGKIYFMAPNQLKWEYHQPYNYQLLFIDSKLFIADGTHFQEVDMSSNKIFEKMGDMISGSMNGKILSAEKDFAVTYYNKEKPVAKLIPKNKKLSEMVKEIWISFDASHLITNVKLIDSSGDFTEIALKNIKLNQPIADSVFKH